MTRVLVGFRNAYVFDVSQTEGVDLPAMHEVRTATRARIIDRLAAFLESKGIELVFTENIAPGAWHELRRTHRHSSRTIEGRNLRHSTP